MAMVLFLIDSKKKQRREMFEYSFEVCLFGSSWILFMEQFVNVLLR